MPMWDTVIARGISKLSTYMLDYNRLMFGLWSFASGCFVGGSSINGVIYLPPL